MEYTQNELLHYQYQSTDSRKLPKGIMDAEAVRRRIGFRPYSSASWPIRGNPIILKIAPTCTHANDMINNMFSLPLPARHCFHWEKKTERITNMTKIITTVFQKLDKKLLWHSDKHKRKYAPTATKAMPGSYIYRTFRLSVLTCELNLFCGIPEK